MSLRKRTLLLISITGLAAIVIFYAVSRVMLLGSYARLEEQNARDNVSRVVNAFNDELDALEGTSGDWANWDDTHQFAEGESDDYVDVNLVDSTFYNLNLNLIVLTNRAGDVVYERAFDLEDGTDLPIPGGLAAALAPDSPIRALGDENRAITGILMLDGTPALVAARPILNNDGDGPSGGTLLFARYVDSARIERLAASTRLSLTIVNYDNSDLPADFQLAKAQLGNGTPDFVRPLDGTTIAGYAVLDDIYGNPAAVLRADMPRAITAQGESTLRYFVLAVVAIGLIFGGLSVFMLERMVLSRVAQLSSSVDTIRGSGDAAGRVTVSGSDELAKLADAINAMIDSLAASQKTVRNSERQLQTIVNNAPVTLWALDNKGEITFLRGKGLEMLGLRSGGSQGEQPDSAVFHTVRPLIESSRKALQGEETSLILRVGARIFDMRCSPLRGDDGDVSGVIGIATDITDQRQAEEALQVAIGRVAKQSQELERIHEYFGATLEQMTATVKLGAPRDELLDYIREVQSQFDRIQQNERSPL